MIVNSWGISPRVASVVVHVWYQSHTIISVSPVRVLQLCFKKLFCLEIKLVISTAFESGQNTSGTINLKVAALVACATCSGASHSSGNNTMPRPSSSIKER